MKSIGLNDHRIRIIAGHYGSGKTEISLNMAIRNAQQGRKTVLVDLDIVNPYFRSAEQEELLKAHNVRLLKPTYAATGVDVPTLPAEITQIFFSEDADVIIDVGGDDAGAAALGCYNAQFAKSDYIFYMVVNPYRPRTETPEQIAEMYNAIALRARMEPDALVCNANIADETGLSDIENGLKTVREAAAILKKEIAFVCAPASLCTERTQFFLVVRYLKPEWMEV